MATTPVGRQRALEPITQSESRSSALDFPHDRAEMAHLSAQSLLKQDYKDDISLEDAKALCLKIMSKTMDSTKLGSEKRELFGHRGLGLGSSCLLF